MTRRPLLRIEQLEDRVVPSSSVWGTPWPDGQFLTLSLAPTGTNISGTGSNLSSVLSEAGPGAEQALLQAFQTWADVANINFGLVADGGEAFGVARAIQDDPRFGDIRIGAIPIASDVVAVTSPFDYFNTYSGDVVLNSSQPIGSTYNLYTVALHEAGHALGLPDNNDPNSVMYEYYTGANTSLDANDIAAIQSLYGPRPANSTNNSFATALSIQRTGLRPVEHADGRRLLQVHDAALAPRPHHYPPPNRGIEPAGCDGFGLQFARWFRCLYHGDQSRQ